MSHRQRTDREKEERRRSRATWCGTAALGIMCAFVLIVGALPHFNQPVFLLLFSLLTCPLSAWLATRCLTTSGSGSRVQAWIALAFVAMIVVGQVVELSRYFPPSTWD